jgi:hypothetical protein
MRVVRPQLAAQFVACDYIPMPCDKQAQDLQGLTGEPEFQSAFAQLSSGGVNLKIAEALGRH